MGRRGGSSGRLEQHAWQGKHQQEERGDDSNRACQKSRHHSADPPHRTHVVSTTLSPLCQPATAVAAYHQRNPRAAPWNLSCCPGPEVEGRGTPYDLHIHHTWATL